MPASSRLPGSPRPALDRKRCELTLLFLHELDEVRCDAARIGIIKQGRLVAEDTARAGGLRTVAARRLYRSLVVAGYSR